MEIFFNTDKLLFLSFLFLTKFQLSSCLHKEYLLDLGAVLDDGARYDRNLFPPTVNGTAIRIDVNIDVRDLRDISELTMTFRTEIYFSQIWNDPRLIFNSTYPKLIYANLDYVTLNPDYMSKFWLPDTIFTNVLSSIAPPKDDDSFTHKNYLAVNGKGDVYFSQRLSLTAACWMVLAKYPFDHQICKLNFESYGIVKSKLEYKWNKVKSVTLENINLPDFKVLNATTTESTATYDENSYSRLRLCFFLERKTSFYFLELYIPAMLIVVSAWLATVGKSSSFSDILSVLLSMLFLYFSYITVMPKVSDVKAMDVFLISCFGFIFFALMQTFINTEENLLNGKEKICNLKNSERDLAMTPVDFFAVNDAKVHPYSDSTLGSDSDQQKLWKKRKVPKIKRTLLQSSPCKFLTFRKFFLYAMYPTTFILFCLFYFVTYMKILHHDDEPIDC